MPKPMQLFARASKAAAFVVYNSDRSDSETAQAAIQIINEDTDGNLNGDKYIGVNRGAYAMVAMAAT